MMKRKRLLIAGAFATAVGYLGSYLIWKQRAITGLQTGSSVIETCLGPVEYCMRGEGSAILVSHGSPGGYDQGSAFSKLVGGQHTFIAVSRPGYLRTPLTTGETPASQADMYAALLDALAIQQATVVGISGGGPSAIQFALRYPTRCRSLVMISGVVQRYTDWELKQTLSLPVRLFKRFYEKVITFDPLLYLLLPFAKLLPDAFATADFLCSVTQYDLRKVGYENDMQQFAAISDYPLEQITAPTSATYGYITTAPKPGWQYTNIVDTLKDRLGVPVAFDTDVNAAALGEYRWGAAQSSDPSIYITVGTGIGGGIYVNGTLLHGLIHPEMGHLQLPRLDGDDFSSICPYHAHCWEGIASGPAITARVGKPAEYLAPDHPVWEIEAHYLAMALTSIIYITSPYRIVLGGGVMQQEHLFPRIRQYVQKLLNGYLHHAAILENIESFIVPPKLGSRAGMLGALELARLAEAKNKL